MTTIFISGATGYVAQHIIKLSLSKGYFVIGSVRSAAKGERLRQLFNSEKFTYEIAEKLENPGAFNQVLQKHPEISVFIHTASPVTMNAKDPEKDTMIPALEGSKNALNAIYEFGHNIKKVILTSSYVALSDLLTPGRTATESTWNSVTWEMAKADGRLAYHASKKYAEKVAWDFVKDKNVGFEFTSINPAYVFGPQAFDEDAKGTLNLSAEMICSLTRLKEGDEVATKRRPFIDVRDVAKAHVLAVERDFAGKRLLMAESNFSQQLALNIIRKQFSHLNLPPGNPDADGKDDLFDNSKTRQLLGFEFIDLETSIRDMVTQYLKNEQL
ncbi:hypothetical protein PGUG_04595 [Meyerozyma guilliermondii ATCC 6260]|uniref:NAD-dependent epimerase/dehydratase domain-containing protein n=1 Tax=Meyerozyma guilliermondii (strain ATCC 6260 / CBS 566 / DSM 6381 / JCM 1539 / NBRC 10279 / NRRL Y-324) TaxID=294746 RepID=A5DMU4_PICGU|nr:uncharacterized protein PGUG_04595 [Meyerozyma guilliermondii ATCC 6260]EDK40497.2 hypothetical protein PGUG_04595 [Meyerozyma guilliermondii ATCC 6260]